MKCPKVFAKLFWGALHNGGHYNSQTLFFVFLHEQILVTLA